MTKITVKILFFELTVKLPPDWTKFSYKISCLTQYLFIEGEF